MSQAPAPQRAKSRFSWAKQLAPPLAFGLALAALYAWGQASLEEHRRFLMPSADAIWRGGFGDPAVRAELARAAFVTGQIALAGLAISIPLGIALGIVMFRWRIAQAALSPYLVALQATPLLAIIPLLQALLGFGFLPKALIVALFTFFAIPTTLLVGLKSLDPGVVDLFRLHKASWRALLIKAALPSAAPALFAGLRIAASLAVIGAIVSELFFISGDGGLGQMLVNSKIDFKYEQMYAALIVSAAMSIAVYAAFSWLGVRLFGRWHPSERDARQ
jgi:NitT/TauT family transport system permease protein